MRSAPRSRKSSADRRRHVAFPCGQRNFTVQRQSGLGLAAGFHGDFRVIREALRVAALTGNAFNPTLGPLVGRYGFGPLTAGFPGFPDEIALAAGALRKARAGLTLDLNGIAKGHALDRLADACSANGINDFLLELGGEVCARGRHPAGRSWQVAIERPGTAGAFQRAVALDGKLATSGNGSNGFAQAGRGYSHIMDPATNRPADLAPASVTVAAPAAMTADALATALFAMGSARPGLRAGYWNPCVFVFDGGAREVATGGFDTRILG